MKESTRWISNVELPWFIRKIRKIEGGWFVVVPIYHEFEANANAAR